MNSRNLFGFEYSFPKLSVLLVLIVLISIEVALIDNVLDEKNIALWKNIDAILLVFLWFSLLTTPVANWLRNIFVLFGWLLMCLLWFEYKAQQDLFTAVLPFCALFYSQLSRLTFRKIMGYHPIHMLFRGSTVHTYSKINKRKSTKTDHRYSIIYSVVGLVLTLVIGLFYWKK